MKIRHIKTGPYGSFPCYICGDLSTGGDRILEVRRDSPPFSRLICDEKKCYESMENIFKTEEIIEG